MSLKDQPLIIKEQEKEQAPLLEEALAVLDRGGVLALPTDTVYGLVARADRPKALKRIYKIKGRDYKKPLVLMVPDRESARPLVSETSPAYEKLNQTFWPGRLTLIVRASPVVRGWGLDKQGKVGLRSPDDIFLGTLMQKSGVPLASTSANRSREPECYSAAEVMQSLRIYPDMIIDGGQLPRIGPSTVVDASLWPPVILRKGAVPRSEIERNLGTVVLMDRVKVLFVCTGNTCRSPMAEGYLKHKLPKTWKNRVSVESAGTAALPGLPATDNARLAARRRGFDISFHRSQPLSRDLVESSDIVVAMEDHHQAAVRDLCSDAEVMLLDEAGVPDPIGGDLESYGRTLEIIERGMARVIKRVASILYLPS